MPPLIQKINLTPTLIFADLTFWSTLDLTQLCHTTITWYCWMSLFFYRRLPTWKKPTSCIDPYFRYRTFKVRIILEHNSRIKILPLMGFAFEVKNYKNFHSPLLLGKSNDKMFERIAFLDSFLKHEFSPRTEWALSDFRYQNNLTSYKKSEKN